MRQGLAIAAGLAGLWTSSALADPGVAPAIVDATGGGATGALATGTQVEVTVEITETPYDGLQALLDSEARDALDKGQYRRAWQFFWRLLQIDPDDARALREAGRVAHALGHFAYAEEALGRVDKLTAGVVDPEIHYLRAEALFALGRKAEAEREFALTEQQLGAGPHDRQGVLWLARIAALRGDLDGACALYLTQLPDDHASPAYAEVMLYVVEAYILSRDWTTAERLLRQVRRHQPEHGRAREMLAWVLDARGKIHEELDLRAVLADEWTDHPRKTLEYARALERAHDYPAALARYREARALGVQDVSGDIDRLALRVSPEVSAGGSLRRDSSGSIAAWGAGATVPVGKRLRLAVSGAREVSDGGLTMNEVTTSFGTGWAILTGDRGGVAGLGATVHDSELGTTFGGSALVQTRPGRRLQLQMRGDLNVPWRESSSTVREGGVVDALGAQVYASRFSQRVLFSLGAQVRRLGLAEMPSTASPHARQLFGAAGVDVTLSSAERRVRGEVHDSEMLYPRSLEQATVVSYRHYEMASDDPFGQRLVLVERASIDELSGVVRRVIGDRGWAGAELRGGLGYDRLRELRLWRVGGSVLMAATRGSRFTFDYDVASESGTGIAGQRSAGSVTLHVDL